MVDESVMDPLILVVGRSQEAASLVVLSRVVFTITYPRRRNLSWGVSIMRI